jgi:hypothetical protein
MDLPNGRVCDVFGLADEDFLGFWGHLFWLRSPNRQLRVHCGVAGSVDIVEAMRPDLATNIVLTDFLADGAEVQVRHRADGAGAGVLITWDYHELMIPVGGTPTSATIARDLLSGFKVTDDPAGLRFSPVVGTGSAIDLLVSSNTVRGVCGLAVKPADKSPMPLGSGKKVAGGELWIVHPEGPERSTAVYVLGSASTTTEFIPLADADPAETQALAERTRFEQR